MNAAARAEEDLRRLNDAAFDEAGVDLTQIDMMLMLTPAERLSALYETATSLARLSLELAASARHEPTLHVLDEPATGLS